MEVVFKSFKLCKFTGFGVFYHSKQRFPYFLLNRLPYYPFSYSLMISGVVVCLHVTGVLEVCLPVFIDGVMSNGKALRYITFQFFHQLYWCTRQEISWSLFLYFSFCFTGLLGTNLSSRNRHKRGTISHSRCLLPPFPTGCPIPHPTTYRRWGEISESVVRWGLRFFHFLERNGMTE